MNSSASKLDSGDNAWMMASTALVYMMTPALAFFYGGLVENKNILNQLFLSLICIAIVTTQWCLFGYSFAFGPGNSAFGSFQFGALRFPTESSNFYGLKPDDENAETFPLLTFVAYQAAVAVVTPALISGALVGRMKLGPYMVFVFLWTTCCYDPLCRWVFYSDGWLRVYGSLDFAGGTVVHIASGVSGLTAAIILGKRHDYDPTKHISGHNLPFTILGAGFLWVSWNGYCGGAALAANGYASLAIVNTNVSAGSALLAWVLTDAIRGTISLSGVCAGLLAGLVAISPAAAFVQPGYSLLIGIIGSLGVYWWLQLKKKFLHIDDTLDTFSCHAMGAIIGGICTGLVCQTDVNPDGYNGAFYGNPIQIWRQLAGILTTIAFSAACTAGILIPMHFTIGIRLSSEDQIIGMDIHGHGERWNRCPSTSANQVTPTTVIVEPGMQDVHKSFQRHSIRDVLQDAFT